MKKLRDDRKSSISKPVIRDPGATLANLPAPQPKQQQFIDCDADIAIYGGAAGSGKSFSLLLDFAKHVDNPKYGAVIFRRTYPQITNEGALWDESQELYRAIGGVPKQSTLEWVFPSGASVTFRHLEHEKNKYDWQGAQLGRLAFDELTHFSQSQFRYMLSRCRSTSGIKPVVRATCNPDAESWVAEWVDWWIDENGDPIPDRSGVIRWFIWQSDHLIWADTKEELIEQFPKSQPKSFTFISALIWDNQALLEKDPGYLANLEAQHPVERARLLGGNWKIKMESGTVFDRGWFPVITGHYQGLQIRFWDIAATAKELASKNSFYTAGTKIDYDRNTGIVVILDAIAQQKGAGAVEELILSTAKQDGKTVKVRWELEGGSEAILWGERLKKQLKNAGFDADYSKPKGDKVARATPLAADAHNGKVFLQMGGWNDLFLSCAQNFDGSKKPLVNDVIDATSGAYACAISHGGKREAPKAQQWARSPSNLRKIF